MERGPFRHVVSAEGEEKSRNDVHDDDIRPAASTTAAATTTAAAALSSSVKSNPEDQQGLLGSPLRQRRHSNDGSEPDTPDEGKEMRRLDFSDLLALDKDAVNALSPEELELHDIVDVQKKRYRWKDKVLWPLQLVFVTLDTEKSSPVAWWLSIALKFVILLAIFTTVVSSEPSMNVVPPTCAVPACDHDPDVCPGQTLCAPTPLPIFDIIEDICIYIFTAEYALKLLSCWTVSPRLAGVAPEADAVAQVFKIKAVDDLRVYHPLEQIARWVMQGKNLIDLACWLPFFVGMVVNISSRQTSFVRALRLLRLIRILRLLTTLKLFEPVHVMTGLLYRTAVNSSPVISVFLFFSFIIIVLFGSIIYLLEAGTFVVNDEYPTGAFIRPTKDRYGYETSPYVSIGTSFYWVIVTGTTGEFVPFFKLPPTLNSSALFVECSGVRRLGPHLVHGPCPGRRHVLLRCAGIGLPRRRAQRRVHGSVQGLHRVGRRPHQAAPATGSRGQETAREDWGEGVEASGREPQGEGPGPLGQGPSGGVPERRRKGGRRAGRRWHHGSPGGPQLTFCYIVVESRTI